ncbi:MAG: DUF1704 domain-containing protein, partial [Bdellovibrionales bacterium]|nr:DUF1704 domain-containing protein [Bdellovibrionales bacterium]
LLYPHYLFAGRLTLGDVLEFEELFEDGAIALPHYEPEWITQRPRIAAFLLYSGFLNTIDLEGVDLISFANSAII